MRILSREGCMRDVRCVGNLPEGNGARAPGSRAAALLLVWSASWLQVVSPASGGYFRFGSQIEPVDIGHAEEACGILSPYDTPEVAVG